ncbi:S1 family peptidase, partial [Acrocarpospora phusangensis]|uniref:S1 family peptidase n=1 Tax=Acrocarpospora phusangensis TaxID=1070424 RepID=UPI00194F5A19
MTLTAVLAAILTTTSPVQAFSPSPNPSPEESIVGGTEANWAHYPYMVRLSSGCTATLISRTAILTAQHCVTNPPAYAYLSNGRTVPVTVYSTMPGYDGRHASIRYDLAVLSVNAADTVGVPIVQVGSPWRTQTYRPGVMSTIAGWGATAPDGSGSGVLRAADVPIISDDDMDDVYNPWWWFDGWIEHLMIGAGGSARAACFGDSGGPLMIWDPQYGRVVQVGVTSWGDANCSKPVAYMELAGPNLAWLASMVPSVQFGWGPCT